MKDVSEPTEIIISVTKDGTYVVNQVKRSIGEIKDILKRLGEAHPEATIILRGERETPYRDIVRVLDACREADMWSVSFAVKDVEKEEEEDEERWARTLAFLENQVREYQRKVRASSEAVQKFKEEHALETGEPSFEADLKKLKDLFEDVRSELLDAKAFKEMIEKKLAELEPTVVTETLVEANPLMAQYKAQLSDLELQLSRMRQKYADRHPQVIKMRDEIESLKALIETTEEKVTTKETRQPNPMYEFWQAVLKGAERRVLMAYVKGGELSAGWTDLNQRLRKASGPEKELGKLAAEDAVNRSLLQHYVTELQKARIGAEKKGTTPPASVREAEAAPPAEEIVFYVEGMVNRPGMYSFSGKQEATLYRAIIMAGGFSPNARKSKVLHMSLDEQGKKLSNVDVTKILKNSELDPAVKNNDVIHVPESFY